MSTSYPSYVAYALMRAFWLTLIRAKVVQEEEETLLHLFHCSVLEEGGRGTFDRSYDTDWKMVTKAAAELTRDEVYLAMLAMMRIYAEICAPKSFKDLITSLDENREQYAPIWQDAVRLLDADIAAGDPFRSV